MNNNRKIYNILRFSLLALLLLVPDLLFGQAVVIERKNIYPPFVLPFMAGMIFLLSYMFIALVRIIWNLDGQERKQLGL
jgi:hypothetical protein